MQPFLHLKGVDWFHAYAPSKEYLDDLTETYDLHEIVEEDIVARHTQDKIDVYDTCLFIVLHFPKYQKDTQKYLNNEFNFILGKEYIVTLTTYQTNHIENIKADYEAEMVDADNQDTFKVSPYYLLYKVLDEMYEKVLRGTRYFSQDIRSLEDRVFAPRRLNREILEEIMTKRRNLVMLKHMLVPQEEILQQLQKEAIKFYGGELEVYFEDIEYKFDKVMRQISLLEEDIESLYDIYNAMVNVKINSIITVLTIFTAIIGVLTLVTGFYGMNLPLPGSENILAWIYIVAGMGIITGLMIVIFRWKKWL